MERFRRILWFLDEKWRNLFYTDCIEKGSIGSYMKDSFYVYVIRSCHQREWKKLKKIRIKRYPPRNFSSKSLWEIIAIPPNSEEDTEFMMLYRVNPKHPAIIEEMTEVVELEVNEKAFSELTWLFKKYEVPFKPIEEGVEIKHTGTKSSYLNDKNPKAP